MICKNCNTEVKPKLDVSWLVIVVSALLFWPVTVIYLAWKYNSNAYICPICNLLIDAEK